MLALISGVQHLAVRSKLVYKFLNLRAQLIHSAFSSYMTKIVFLIGSLHTAHALE